MLFFLETGPDGIMDFDKESITRDVIHFIFYINNINLIRKTI